ncbi:MAG: glycosyltransferase family 2 protein [Saprospiraceae bacterium]|nr:glycosyltransferase family 2 protein [Saprospiraceae bacterium]
MRSLSYIITTYNRPHEWLMRAIQSVIAERVPHSELIIVDDCSSTPAFVTPSVKEAFGDRLQLIRHDQNRGVAQSRNTGLWAARYYNVVFLDDDDVSFPNRSTALLNAAVEQPQSFILGRTRMYANDVDYRVVPEIYDYSATVLLYLANPPHINGILWRRAALIEIGGFDNRVPYFSEHNTMVRLILRGHSVVQIGDVVAQFQYLNQGLTNLHTQNNKMQEQLLAFYAAMLDDVESSELKTTLQSIRDYIKTQPQIQFEDYLAHIRPTQ